MLDARGGPHRRQRCRSLARSRQVAPKLVSAMHLLRARGFGRPPGLPADRVLGQVGGMSIRMAITGFDEIAVPGCGPRLARPALADHRAGALFDMRGATGLLVIAFTRTAGHVEVHRRPRGLLGAGHLRSHHRSRAEDPASCFRRGYRGHLVAQDCGRVEEGEPRLCRGGLAARRGGRLLREGRCEGYQDVGRPGGDITAVFGGVPGCRREAEGISNWPGLHSMS